MADFHDMTRALGDSMSSRTGRSLDDWVREVQLHGPDPLDQNAVRRWLGAEHQIKQNSQWAIAFAAAKAAGWRMPTVEEFTDQLYSGPKAALRPLHDAVLAVALASGADAEAQGRASYIPVVRKAQFAAIAPGPRGTLRVGLRFREQPPTDARLEPARGFAQATHWVQLAGDADPVDGAASLEPLLLAAYQQNG